MSRQYNKNASGGKMELQNLKRMAQGGQADIYDLGNDKILRVFRDPGQEVMLKNEMMVINILRNAKVCVPEVFEFLTVEGCPAVVMEKVTGNSMIEQLKKQPLTIKQQAEKLATLHMELSKINIEADLKTIQQRVRFCTLHSEFLSENQREFVLRQTDAFPEDNGLCHGDFHPGNILISEGKYYMIDWFGAYRGHVLSDVAHTYLLMKNVPRIPGMGAARHRVMKFTANFIANAYIRAIYRLKPFDWAEFSQWTVMQAAVRSVYGLPEERPRMAAYIEKCRNHSHAKDMSSWYKMI
jgi:aminoglycoside phosphotransferase (APT) family kinase protein